MPTWKAIVAYPVAAGLRGHADEVVGLLDEQRRLRMTWTAKLERVADQILRAEDVQDLAPHRHSLHRTPVADQIHPVLCSGEEDVDTIRRLQEAGPPRVVAADQRDDDHLRLFALEVVDCGDAES